MFSNSTSISASGRGKSEGFSGAAFGWAVPMAFAAQTGETPQLAWLVFGSAVIWAVIYDTFYAMVDREDDKKIGVKSTAILFGEVDLFVIAGLQLLMLVALVLIGYRAELGFWYYLSVVAAAMNNVVPLFGRNPGWLVFGFGLFHGFGFASVLGEMPIPDTYLVLSLLGFNLGVELGQLAIVAVVKRWIAAPSKNAPDGMASSVTVSR